MAWIELTPDEVRAARIEMWALQSAGLRPDPLVVAMATAEPHSAKWVALQDTRERYLRGATPESTNDISEAMEHGLTTMLEAERRAIESGPPGRDRVAARKEAKQEGWLSRLFGR